MHVVRRFMIASGVLGTGFLASRKMLRESEEDRRTSGEGSVFGQDQKTLFSSIVSPLQFRLVSSADAPPPHQMQHTPSQAPFLVTDKKWRKMAASMWKSLVGTTETVLESDEYVVLYDNRTRNPLCAMQRITKQQVAVRQADRKDSNFYEDTRLDPVFRASLDDYKGSGFDRGHMCPAGDFSFNQKAMDQTFCLTNISPQVGQGFNRDYWSRLEKFCRLLSNDWDEVLVFTGPLFLPEKDPVDGKYYVKYQVLGNPPSVAVPTHFFKFVVAVRNLGPPSRQNVPQNPPRKVIDVNPVSVVDTPINSSRDLHAAGPSEIQRVAPPPRPPPPSQKQVAAAAFILPNKPIKEDVPLSAFLVAPQQLEHASGLRFRNFLAAYTQGAEPLQLCSGSSCALPAAGWWDKKKPNEAQAKAPSQ
eukprot:TRINITY_DN11387_c0_g1_i1.p1 TRINITY_DN11387_c0_g1~~TRINITY_DN11387_c0_g1_i1.p1  ORF type:complete len:416 (+),score=131.06 TRINITY_DN11387_c0_g1_i1:55-1302(+)